MQNNGARIQRAEEPLLKPSNVAATPANRQHCSANWLAVTAIVVCVLSASDALALRIRVRARSDVTAEAYRRGTKVLVKGTLRDSRGRPVSDADIGIELRPAPTPDGWPDGDWSAAARTSSHGRFESEFELPERWHGHTRWTLSARFSGTTAVGRGRFEETLNITKPRAKLHLEVRPTRITSDVDSAQISVSASLLDMPLNGVALKLRVDGQPRAMMRTAEDGWVLHKLPLSDLMPAGVRALRVELAESTEFNAAVATTRIEVRDATLVTLRSWDGTADNPCTESQICLRGEVRSVDPLSGATPVADAGVTLHANKRRLLTATTDQLGAFRVRLDGHALRNWFGTGDIGIVAEARPSSAFADPGWSDVRVVRAPLPSALSEWFYLALLGCISIGLVFRRVRDQLRERRAVAQLREESAGLPSRSVRHAGGGGTEVRRFRGLVVHGESGDPTRARIDLRQTAGQPVGPGDNSEMTTAQRTETMTTIVAGDGTFDVPDLDDGDWHVAVTAAEHETLILRLTIPHTGIYDGCELFPRSQRAIVRSEYGRVLRERTGREVDWRNETPRSAEPRWMRAARRGHAEIRRAVNAVDRALYGRPTTEREVEDARAALQATEETTS